MPPLPQQHEQVQDKGQRGDEQPRNREDPDIPAHGQATGAGIVVEEVCAKERGDEGGREIKQRNDGQTQDIEVNACARALVLAVEGVGGLWEQGSKQGCVGSKRCNG